MEHPLREYHTYLSGKDLPHDLWKYCSGEVSSTGFEWFHHPMYVSMFPILTPCPMKELLAFRYQQMKAYLVKGELESALFRYERGWRMPTLVRWSSGKLFQADDPVKQKWLSKKFWALAEVVWLDAEFDESDLIWSRLMETPVPHRKYMTDAASRVALAALPEEVTLYRGTSVYEHEDELESALSGWSWTTNREVARFFASRFLRAGHRPYVLEAEVPKSEIVAYLLGRGESEALVKPGNPKIKIRRLDLDEEPCTKSMHIIAQGN